MTSGTDTKSCPSLGDDDVISINCSDDDLESDDNDSPRDKFITEREIKRERIGNYPNYPVITTLLPGTRVAPVSTPVNHTPGPGASTDPPLDLTEGGSSKSVAVGATRERSGTLTTGPANKDGSRSDEPKSTQGSDPGPSIEQATGGTRSQQRSDTKPTDAKQGGQSEGRGRKSDGSGGKGDNGSAERVATPKRDDRRPRDDGRAQRRGRDFTTRRGMPTRGSFIPGRRNLSEVWRGRRCRPRVSFAERPVAEPSRTLEARRLWERMQFIQQQNTELKNLVETLYVRVGERADYEQRIYELAQRNLQEATRKMSAIRTAQRRSADDQSRCPLGESTAAHPSQPWKVERVLLGLGDRRVIDHTSHTLGRLPERRATEAEGELGADTQVMPASLGGHGGRESLVPQERYSDHNGISTSHILRQPSGRELGEVVLGPDMQPIQGKWASLGGHGRRESLVPQGMYSVPPPNMDGDDSHISTNHILGRIPKVGLVGGERGLGPDTQGLHSLPSWHDIRGESWVSQGKYSDHTLSLNKEDNHISTSHILNRLPERRLVGREEADVQGMPAPLGGRDTPENLVPQGRYSDHTLSIDRDDNHISTGHILGPVPERRLIGGDGAPGADIQGMRASVGQQDLVAQGRYSDLTLGIPGADNHIWDARHTRSELPDTLGGPRQERSFLLQEQMERERGVIQTDWRSPLMKLLDKPRVASAHQEFVSQQQGPSRSLQSQETLRSEPFYQPKMTGDLSVLTELLDWREPQKSSHRRVRFHSNDPNFVDSETIRSTYDFHKNGGDYATLHPESRTMAGRDWDGAEDQRQYMSHDENQHRYLRQHEQASVYDEGRLSRLVTSRCVPPAQSVHLERDRLTGHIADERMASHGFLDCSEVADQRGMHSYDTRNVMVGDGW